MKTSTTIDQVITALEEIIQTSQSNNDPLGYFPALYHRVTVKVKEGIANDFFDDGPRMEQLDVVFANRYLDAYYAYQQNQSVTASWEKAFELSTGYWPIVLQHLLIGMNAHINLDLGIAAAEISKGKDINALENDFNKINQVLSSLVSDVEEELSAIWPTLKKILMRTRKVDDFLIDFSMEMARDGAWRFAKKLAGSPLVEWPDCIAARDEKVANNAKLITAPGFLASTMLKVVRLGERGTVGEKVDTLVV